MSKKNYDIESIQHLLRKAADSQLSSEELETLRAHAQDDPFIADALEGYLAQASANHSANISAIRDEIIRRGHTRRRSVVYRWAAAAGVLFFIAAGWWWISSTQKETTLSDAGVSIESIDVTEESLEPAESIVKPELIVEEGQKATDDEIVSTPSKNITPSEKPVATLSQDEPTAPPDVLIREDAGRTGRSAYNVDGIRIEETELAELDVKDVEDNPEYARYGNMALAQDKMDVVKVMRGVVRNKSGKPMIGATIRDLNSGSHVTSDLDGNFALPVSDTSKLIEAEQVGYIPHQFSLDFDTDNEIVLNEQPKLEEVRMRAYAGVSKGSPDNIISYQPEGGFDAFFEYIHDNRSSTVAGDVGSVVVLRFDIRPNGKVRNITVEESAGKVMDNEIIQLLRKGPRWATHPDKQSIRAKLTVEL